MPPNNASDHQKQAEFSLSIIVATRNEEKFIGTLLDSLANQSFPKDHFEVLIIDGKSTDATIKTAESYKTRLNLRILANPKVYSTFAFNIGIEEAKSRLFAIVGAHSYLSKNYIEKSLETFYKVREKEPKLAGVGGICLNENKDRVQKVTDLVYSSFFSGARSCRYSRVPHFSDSIVFGVFDKETVVENGKFDEDFTKAGNDDELTIRLHNRGFKFFTNPDIVVHYFPRTSFGKFLRQTYNYGVAKGCMVRKGCRSPELSNSASLWFVPFSFLTYEILLLFILAFFGLSFILAFVPLILYVLVNVFISIRLLAKTKTALCLALPPTYFIFHNVLGLSSLMGLILKKRAYL